MIIHPFNGNSMNRLSAAMIFLTTIAANVGAAVALNAQDLSGEWVSLSPLGTFVDDDSQQPVNTFRIEKINDGEFKVKYMGSKATGFTLHWLTSAGQFEGVHNTNRGKATFVVRRTRDPDVWNCEIEADYPLNQNVFFHKDTWKRVESKVKGQQFRESVGILLTETKEGLVAYDKLTGMWSKIEVAAPVSGMSRLNNTSLSEDFAAALINGELIGYSNRASRWSRMSIPPEHLKTTEIRHTGNSVTVTIGRKLYVLSLATGEWESPEEVQNSVKRAGLEGATANVAESISRSTNPQPDTQHGKRADRTLDPDKPEFETDVLKAAQRYRDVRDKYGARHPMAVESKRELERVIEQVLDQKLKDEQARIALLKDRINLLEKQVEQRIANRSSVVHRRVDELIDATDKATKEMGQPNVKPTFTDRPQVAILRYEDHAELTTQIKSDVDALLIPYAEHLKKIGFKLESGQVVLRIQPGMGTAHYYHNTLSIVTDPLELSNKATVRREYNHHALAVALGPDANDIFEKCSGIESGLADYFGCSSCNDPAARGNVSWTIENELSFAEVPDTTHRHAFGEIVGGTLWEMRGEIGKEILDPLLYKAWVGIAKTDASKGQSIRFATSLLNAAQKENPDLAKAIRTVLERRGMKLDSIVLNQRPLLRYENHEELTAEMRRSIEDVLVPYAEHLKRLGFKLENGQVVLRLQPGMNNSHYYHNIVSIVTDPKEFDEPTMRREYTHHALAVALGSDAKEIFESCSGIESGLSDYFGCSSCDDPQACAGRRMDNQLSFDGVPDTTGRHALGEIVSGALWEMRGLIGKEDLDPLVCKAWAALPKTDVSKGQSLRFTTALLEVAQKENPERAKKMGTIFEARGLKFP